MSYTQVPNVQDLNLEGAPCITQCPAVLLVSKRASADSPAPPSTYQLKIAVAWSPKTASTGSALKFTVRDSARHLSIQQQQQLPREEGDEEDLYHFQVRLWTLWRARRLCRSPPSNLSISKCNIAGGTAGSREKPAL